MQHNKPQSASAPASRTAERKKPLPRLVDMGEQRICSLTTRALEDLARSGLTAEDAVAMRLSPVMTPVGAVDNYKIPYLDMAGKETEFYRNKIFDSDSVKYLQPAGTSPEIYFPPWISWLRVINDRTPLLITEGEKKAACAAKHGFPTLGLGGVDSWRRGGRPLPVLEELPISDGRIVYIVFDVDAKPNPRVRRAETALATYLSVRGANVFIVTLPAAAGQKVGLDDFLVTQGAEALQTVLDTAEPFDDIVGSLNTEYFTVRNGGQTLIGYEHLDPIYHRPTVNLMSASDARLWLANKTRYDPETKKSVGVIESWIKSPYRRQYTGIVFSPGTESPAGSLNLWQGFAVEPEEGDCSLFLQHIWENICHQNEEVYQYVIGWMAHAVQYPSQLPGTSLVMRGGMGVGKGVFATEFGSLFGHHYRKVSNAKHFLGNFNAHLASALVVYADEAFWAGDKSHEGAIKDLITGETRILEHKGKDVFEIKNYTRLIVAGNEEWLVPAGMRERRFLVLDISERRQQDIQYFSSIVDQMQRHGGRAALLHYLLRIPLDGFEVRTLPSTAATVETQLISLPLIGEFFFNMLAEGVNTCGSRQWLTEVLVSDIQRKFRLEHPALSTAQHGLSIRLGTAIRSYIPGVTTKTVAASNPENAADRVYCFPSLALARKNFEKRLGAEIKWANPWQHVRQSAEPEEQRNAIPPPIGFKTRRARTRRART